MLARKLNQGKAMAANTQSGQVRRSRGGWWKWFFMPLLILALGFAAYIWLALTWAYSEGERVGVLQKFSRKGYICKTEEGELAMYVVGGLSPQIWDFTVRNAAVAAQLNATAGQRVRLHYSEHRGLPTSCFGDTGYFVDAVTSADPSIPFPAVPSPAPVPAATPAPATAAH